MDVLIYDDERHVAAELQARLQGVRPDDSVVACEQKDFDDLLQVILDRRRAWRESPSLDAGAGHPVDTADVVVVDYDLLNFSKTTDTTGEHLAYLLRCFTGCGFIVVLNEYGTNPFHLSLASPPDGFVDLHLGIRQLDNLGLWRTPFTGYRPWYWPVIPRAKENFEQCVTDVLENLDTPVLSLFKLDAIVDWLPGNLRDSMAAKVPIEEVTFRDFARLPGGGVAQKESLPPEQLSRTVAARVVALLNSALLPEQSVLVDAPHLIPRLPCLLADGHDDPDTWNRLCDPTDAGVASLLDPILKQYRFEREHWLWRPAWLWPAINTDEEIPDVRDPWNRRDVAQVFCEDVSRFLPSEVTREFMAKVAPPFILRHILDRHAPEASQHVEEAGGGGALDPYEADYTPEALLALLDEHAYH